MGNHCCTSRRNSKDSANSKMQDGILLGIGNPLLDVVVTVTPEFLSKYDLQKDKAVLIHASESEMYRQMLSDILENDSNDTEYVLGGAAYNAIRVAQWILGYPRATAFMGAIGNDVFGRRLYKEAAQEGIIGEYQIVDSHPTGTCAVLVTGKHRALVACIGAAKLFSKDFLTDPHNFTLVQNAKFYYATGFFLTGSPESVLLLATYAAEHSRVFCMNLSAEYISKKHGKKLKNIMPYVDILFGNRAEALAFAHSQNLGTENLEKIALKLVSLAKVNNKFGRVIVITQGVDPVIVATEKEVKTFEVPPIREEDFLDRNGAGEAFAGGFLAQYIQGYTFDNCVQCGNWCAAEVIKRSGCRFLKELDFMSAHHTELILTKREGFQNV